MSSNFIDKETKNPYRKAPYVEKTCKINHQEISGIGKITSTISGEFGDRKAYISTGYIGDEDRTNYFVLSRLHLELLIEQLQSILTEIDEDKACYQYSEEILKEFHTYLDSGHVESIIIRKLKMDMPGFNSLLYIPFNIKPVFKNDIPLDAGVNLEFNFIQYLHLDMNETKYNDTLNNLRNGHTEIPITFIGYDRKEEIKKLIASAQKDLKDFDPSKRKPPTPEQREIAKKTLEKMGYVFPNK